MLLQVARKDNIQKTTTRSILFVWAGKWPLQANISGAPIESNHRSDVFRKYAVLHARSDREAIFVLGVKHSGC